MKTIFFCLLIFILTGESFSQDSIGRYHLQTYSSIMEIDSTSEFNSMTLDKYFTIHWDKFILTNGKTNYFHNCLLDTELLRFQNHNLFSKGPLKFLEYNFEQHVYINNDSLTFWFGGMNMPHYIAVKNDSNTFVVFPEKLKNPITVITKLGDKEFLYKYYFTEGEEFRIETKTKAKNEFKHTLGIKNKNELLVLLFDNVIQ
ncbi:MAG: hypothetical protein ACI8Q1_000681 [Parvicella sp.]|jgi:hypothetical protein